MPTPDPTAVPVWDDDDSLTVDAPVANPIAARLSDGAAFLPTPGGRLSVDASGVAVPVTDNGGLLSIDDGGGTISIDDGAGSLTIDNSILSITGAGVELGALRVTLANDSTGLISVDDNGVSLSIDDNGGSLTVDAPVGTPLAARLSDGVTFLTTTNGRLSTTEENSAAVKTAVEILDNIVAGSEAQVDVITVPALIAGTARIGGVYPIGGQIIDEGGTVRAISRAFANATLSGNTAVVAAQGAGVRIRVLSYTIVALLAVTVKFQSATTDICAGMPFGANGGIAVPYNPHGLFETTANQALNVNLSLGTTVGVNVVWCPAT